MDTLGGQPFHWRLPCETTEVSSWRWREILSQPVIFMDTKKCMFVHVSGRSASCFTSRQLVLAQEEYCRLEVLL